MPCTRCLHRALFSFVAIAFNLAVPLFSICAAENQAPANKPAATPARPKKKREATGLVLGENRATPIERIKAAKGFEVELLYSVPSAELGSWVNPCLDDKGRILASDKYGGLFRFAAPPAGEPLDPASIEPVPAGIRAVNGMVWAFDALYVAVNDYEKKIESGLYRITDSDGERCFGS